MRARGALQLLAPLMLLCALGFALPAWLYAERIGHTLRAAQSSRLQFTLDDLKGDFEHGLAQGYAVRDLSNAQAALEAEARLDPAIDALAVLDAGGAIVSQAGPLAHPTAPPSASIVLLNPQGEAAGTLAAWASHRTQHAILGRARIVLALAALAATLFTATAAMAVMAWLTRRKEAVLDAIAEGLEHPHRPGDPRTATMVDEVNQRTATTLVEIAAVRHLAQQGEA